MTVQELIDFLKAGDPRAAVVAFDHFGRPIDLTAGDFTFGAFDGPSGRLGPCLEVTAVDVGPEPE